MIDYNLIKKLKDVHFGSQLELYMSKKLQFSDYDIYLSDLIEDNYWNFAINLKSKNKDEFLVEWKNIKNDFIKYKRQAIVYLTPELPIYEKKDELGLSEIYTDSWLMLENLKDFEYSKSKLNINIEEVDKNNLEDFIQGVSDGFSSGDSNDPYDSLSEGYKIALRESFKKKNTKYKIKHYLARYNNIVVGTATVNYNDEVACVYNVTTNRNYKKNGICKEIMSCLIKDMVDKGIKIICLQTEKGFYTEEVYLKLGFKKIFDGIAYGDKKMEE